MTLWLTIAAMGVVTFASRLSLIVLLERVHVPLRVRQALRFVPAAALSAIIFPELLLPEGHFDLSVTNVRLLAGLVTAVVAWRARNFIWALASGMGTLWLLQALGG